MSPARVLVPMSHRDLHRYHHTLRLVLEHRLTGAQEATSAGLSERHIWRLLARLRPALIHSTQGAASG